MKTGLTKKQKVTEVYYNAKDPTAEVYTHDTKLKKRLLEYAAKFPELCQQTDDDEQGGLRFEIDKSRISIGAIVMGSGMSLVMTDIGTVLGMTETLLPGIAVGAAGLVMVLTTYPICRKILNSRKKKFAPQIMELSERVIKGQGV